jgi:hypothetical protein
MTMKTPNLPIGIVVAMLAFGVSKGIAGGSPASGTASSWHDTLLPDSQLTDQCPPCGRPDLLVPMWGRFDLRLIESNPLFTRYALERIWFMAGDWDTHYYELSGKGTFTIGGEVALTQEMSLELLIADNTNIRLCYFTNSTRFVQRLWPMLQISLEQTNGLPAQTFHLDLSAAPFREIWFSTANGFHGAIWQWPTNYASPGDLLSSEGRIVKRNQELTARLGFMPVVPDLGLDAVDLLPGGEIAFSIQQDMFSGTLGLLHGGDVLSDRGRVVTNYAALIGAFGPEPPPMDEGLDALHVMPGGELYFSVTNDFFSERLGRTVGRGDLLSSRGAIVKANSELIARFSPADAKKDYGLDALYVWPSGEIWFSVETGFSGQHFEPYKAGDLLSDQGYVVYRNLDLLLPFSPLEDLADFGLDALFIVTDVAELPSGATPLHCQPLIRDQPTSGLTIRWEGGARVFQVEKATNVLGPWQPISAILTDSSVTDPGALRPNAKSFYRIRQW